MATMQTAQSRLLRREQRSAYFSPRGWVDGLVHPHVELWIEHVLDEAAELHQAVGLQVVQRDIVQRWNLHQNKSGCHLHVSVLWWHLLHPWRT